MKQRVAVIVPGGVGKQHYIPSLVQLLQRLSVSQEIHLYSFSTEELHPVLIQQNIRYYAAPTPLFRIRKISAVNVILKILIDHRSVGFSFVQSFWISPSGWIGLLIKKILNIPFVLVLPGGDTVFLRAIHYGGLKTPLHRLMIAWCCGYADHVIILSEYQKKVMERYSIRPEAVSIVPYGVDTHQFNFQPNRLSTPLQLVSVGSINQVKNVFLQIQTFASLRRYIDCRLTIVGPDLLNGETQIYAEQMQVAEFIEWKGQTDHSEIPLLLQSSHFLLHTAMYDAEAVVIMEAFAAGTVVVGTQVGLLADCDPERECSVDGENPDLLAEKIVAIAGDPERYSRLQMKNRKFAEQHSIDWTAMHYEQLVKHLRSA